MSKTIDNIIYSDDMKTVEGVENKEITSAVIKEGVTTIDWEVFMGCTQLQRVDIPDSVTYIKPRAFYNCTNLKEIHITNLSAWIELDFEQNPLHSKNITLYLNNEPVDFTDFVIPEGTKKIGINAFLECKNLQTVVVPKSVASIGAGAFYECSNVQSFVLPEGVTSIGNLAFCRCSSVQSFVLPAGVTEIQKSAFSSCSNLKSITIPVSVTKIGENSFQYCTNLQEVIYLGSAKDWSKIKFTKSKEKTELKKLIKDFAVQEAKDAKNKAKDAKIKEIQTASVEGFMTAMKEDYPSFKFQILNSTSANQVVFIMGGKNATVIQLSSNVATWNEKVQKFLSIFCDESKTNTEIEGAIKANKIKIAAIKKNFAKPQIEADEMNLFIDELPEMKNEVKNSFSTDSCSFFYYAKIKKLTFARNTLMDRCTFYRQRNFESIVLPENVTVIEKSAFSGCENLQSIILPEIITSIEGSAFFECKNLLSIVIPPNVTSIGRNAFQFCTNLQNVTIPESVTKIEDFAFKNCKIDNLTHTLLKIENGCCLSSDGKKVLYRSNYNMQEIVIPDGVTTIGDFAFQGCGNLQSVVLPKSVAKINWYSFSECPNLTITFDGTKEEWEKVEGCEIPGKSNVNVQFTK